MKSPEIFEEGQIKVCKVGRSMIRPATNAVTSSYTSFAGPLWETIEAKDKMADKDICAFSFCLFWLLYCSFCFGGFGPWVGEESGGEGRRRTADVGGIAGVRSIWPIDRIIPR
jgi:hypothetical protein